MLSSSPMRTPNLQLAPEQPSTGECWISPKKDTSCPREKEEPQQDGRRGEIGFRVKSRMHQWFSEGPNRNFCTPGGPTETEPGLPLSVWVSPAQRRVSSSLLQGQRLWVQQTWVWHKPSWRRSPLTPHRAFRHYTGLGKQTLGPWRKEQWPHKRLTQTCLWVSTSLWLRRGSAVARFRVRGTECGSVCMGPFEGGHLYLHYLHHNLASG